MPRITPYNIPLNVNGEAPPLYGVTLTAGDGEVSRRRLWRAAPKAGTDMS
jgi:hypothetical protein